MLADTIDREDGPLSRLAPPDRARAQSLAALTLRHMPRLDRVLDGFLDRKPPLRALNALRVCAAEILVDGIAAHGAVNAAVEIVRGSQKTKHLAGMVNAVGRKLGDFEGIGAPTAPPGPKIGPSWPSPGPVFVLFFRSLRLRANEARTGRDLAGHPLPRQKTRSIRCVLRMLFS